jgi:hypothetical protein
MKIGKKQVISIGGLGSGFKFGDRIERITAFSYSLFPERDKAGL